MSRRLPHPPKAHRHDLSRILDQSSQDPIQVAAPATRFAGLGLVELLRLVATLDAKARSSKTGGPDDNPDSAGQVSGSPSYPRGPRRTDGVHEAVSAVAEGGHA